MWRIDPSHLPVSIRFIYVIYSRILQMICLSLTVPMAIHIPSMLQTNTTAAIDITSKLLYCVLLFAKVVSYPYISEELLPQALCFERTLYSEGDSVALAIYAKHVRYCHGLSNFFYTSTIFTGTAFCGFGIFNSYQFHRLHESANVTLKKPLPLMQWYPFDENRYHVWALAQQVVSITVCAMYVISVQIFSNCTMLFLRSQLKVLQTYFRRFDEHSCETGPLAEGLKSLGIKHQNLIRYINRVNEAFKATVFLEYAVISVILGLVLLQVIAGMDASLNGTFMFVVSSQLLLLAWTADEIVVQSMKLATALFESNWYVHDTELVGSIKFMIARCQKPLSIDIGPFGRMSILSAMSKHIYPIIQR
ncbi:odorant receptor 49b-like isoform X2 [Cylas formicarius]|uniref:odorant receptor 49b-like isoform X2 n=1 Tax=Cylas formicarius TaxID=197179 RepID=UPI0029586659|nr:odorant receptor 49b-like isoform X2 [Cylas formicarius]